MILTITTVGQTMAIKLLKICISLSYERGLFGIA